MANRIEIEEMMKKIRIDRVNKKLIISKGIAKEASVYGTAEYEALEELQNKYPIYDIQVQESKKRSSGKKDTLRGLTFEYMERFVEKNGTEEQKKELADLRNPVHDDGLTSKKTSYIGIRKWFLATFPQVLDYQKKIDALLARESA